MQSKIPQEAPKSRNSLQAELRSAPDQPQTSSVPASVQPQVSPGQLGSYPVQLLASPYELVYYIKQAVGHAERRSSRRQALILAVLPLKKSYLPQDYCQPRWQLLPSPSFKFSFPLLLCCTGSSLAGRWYLREVRRERQGRLRSGGAKRKKAKTINITDSLVVTHPTTNVTAHCLSTAERTGSPVFSVLWSIAKVLAQT
jgi:hypothetical protein